MTTEEPTPCRPPLVLYALLSNLPPACRVVKTRRSAGTPFHACRPGFRGRCRSRSPSRLLQVLREWCRSSPQDARPPHCLQFHKSDDSGLSARYFRYTYQGAYALLRDLPARKYCWHHTFLFWHNCSILTYVLLSFLLKILLSVPFWGHSILLYHFLPGIARFSLEERISSVHQLLKRSHVAVCFLLHLCAVSFPASVIHAHSRKSAHFGAADSR